MTILHFDGFETLGTAATSASDVQSRLEVREDVVNSSSLSSSLIDDFDSVGYALRMPNTAAGQSMRIRYELPSSLKVKQNASVGTFSIGARIKVPTNSVNFNIFGWHTDSGSPNRNFRVSASGEDIVIQSTTVASNVVSPGAWAYIEWEFKPTFSGYGGYEKVYVDGVEVYDSGPANISGSFYTAWGFSINTQTSVSGVDDNWIAYDDLVILHLDGTSHTKAIGPRRIHRATPTSDVSTQWTPSTGSDNYSLINHQEFVGSLYVHTNTDGHVDTYELSDVSGVDVEAVQVEAECINDTGGTPTLNVGLDDGTAADDGDVVDNTTDNSYVRKIFESKPSGGAWTTADFNNTNVRIRFES